MATSKCIVKLQIDMDQKLQKERIHVVGVVIGSLVILADCRTALVVPGSASANKMPCSETEDKKKMTIQIRLNKFIKIPTLYEP